MTTATRAIVAAEAKVSRLSERLRTQHDSMTLRARGQLRAKLSTACEARDRLLATGAR